MQKIIFSDFTNLPFSRNKNEYPCGPVLLAFLSPVYKIV